MPDLFPVFYNLEPVTIGPISNSAVSMVVLSEKPVSNLKIDDKIFFLKSVYLYRPSSTNYLVLRLIADPINESGDTLYLVAQIGFGNAETGKTFPIDTLLSSTDVAPKTVTWDLNQDIKDGKGAKKYTKNGTTTILLDTESHIIKMTTNNPLNVASKFYTQNITDIMLEDTTEIKATPAVMRKSIMDWNISCELQGEDEDSVNNVKASQDITPYTTILTMASLAGAAAALYSTTPFIFRNMIIPLAEFYNDNGKGLPLFSISFLWNFVLMLIIIQLFVLGVTGSSEMFFYLFFGVLSIWFLCNKASRDSFGNLQETSNMVTGKAINIDYLAMFASSQFNLIGSGFMAFAAIIFFLIFIFGFVYLKTDRIAPENQVTVYFPFFLTMIFSVILFLLSNAYHLTEDSILHLATYVAGVAVFITFIISTSMMSQYEKK